MSLYRIAATRTTKFSNGTCAEQIPMFWINAHSEMQATVKAEEILGKNALWLNRHIDSLSISAVLESDCSVPLFKEV